MPLVPQESLAPREPRVCQALRVALAPLDAQGPRATGALERRGAQGPLERREPLGLQDPRGILGRLAGLEAQDHQEPQGPLAPREEPARGAPLASLDEPGQQESPAPLDRPDPREALAQWDTRGPRGC